MLEPPGEDVSSSHHRPDRLHPRLDELDEAAAIGSARDRARLDDGVTQEGSTRGREALDGTTPATRVLPQLGGTHTRPTAGPRPASRLDEDVTVAALPPEPVEPDHREPLLRPGMTLGRYLLLSEVGSGGMGVVMAAYDRELDRRVALKLLRPGLSRSGEARMRREAQALAQLEHPAVVSVFEVGSIDGQPFIAMEYVDGLTFDAWASRYRGQWRKLVEVAIEAGRGLAAAHAVGLVHRDIKPSNILVGVDGRVCVADFGIATPTGRTVDSDVLPIEAGRRASAHPDAPDATALDSSRRSWPPFDLPELGVATSAPWQHVEALTEAGAVVGTPAYMAPEQHRGAPVDARSDQFAFCVTLYRVLYERAPFAGADLDTLRAAVSAGKVEPPPAGSAVPSAVRRVLLRGLCVEPERRWPSMTALLEALARTLRRRRWVALAGALGLTSVATTAALLAEPAAGGLACPTAEERLAGVWDDERVVALRDAFAASELPYALDTWARTQERLDQHAASWAERYQALCAEMGDTGASPALDREMACLRSRREELRALVELLAEGHPQVVAKATQAAAELAPVGSCRSEGAEAAAMASPRPEQQAAVDEVRLTLARAEAAYKAGTIDVGVERAQAALETARTLGYVPVEVEALYRLGMLQGLAGQLDEAVRNLGDAALRGVEARHDRVVARAAIAIAFVVGYQQGRPEDGEVWLRHATAALERLEPDPVLDADLRVTRAALLTVQGHFEAALPGFRLGLAEREQALGADHPLVASSYNNLGSALVELGRYDQALEALEHAKAIWERGYGPRHPLVATALNGIGVVLQQSGRYEEARQRLEAALVLREAVFGRDHVNVAITLDNLGAVLAHLGAYDDARRASARALELRAKHLGVRHPHYAASLVNLGWVAERQGRFDEACELHRQAIEIWEEALGLDHPYLGHPLTSLGRAERLRGRPQVAVEVLGRALRIREAANKPLELAETRLAMAQALWPDDPARAHDLAAKASADVHAAIHGPDELRREIDRWLAEHPAPSGP